MRPTNPTGEKEFPTYIQFCCIIDIEELIIFAFSVCLFLSCEKAEENRSISNRSRHRERERERERERNSGIICLAVAEEELHHHHLVLCGWVDVILLVFDL
jgi:hypothetical protein